jgi:hypothetical protein
MLMAKIFTPIRRRSAAAAGPEAILPVSAASRDTTARRQSRVGAQPVTNASPSGLFAPAPVVEPAAPPEGSEETWMALLELVFAETGWPDVE